MGARKDRNGAGRNTLERLVRAAVRHAEVLDTPESEDTMKDDYHKAFMATDEELREAALAFRRGLSPCDRQRIAR